ncbi:MAG: hypothetical protein M1815_003211 [Lichina confinis]|nr:MAG: hypothetical protein M1815_003211 [Lichina confinis]
MLERVVLVPSTTSPLSFSCSSVRCRRGSRVLASGRLRQRRHLSVSAWRHSLAIAQASSTTVTGGRPLQPVWFTGYRPALSSSIAGSGGDGGGAYDVSSSAGQHLHDDHRPPDERTLQLGRTLRILRDRLPTLLQTPLPQDILSPQIMLHLFPSTHPHLPTVSGKVAYVAALWTAPVVWGRVPIFGNVRLEILSERMLKGRYGSTTASGGGNEQFIVRWRTIGKSKGGAASEDNGVGGRGSGSSVAPRISTSRSRSASIMNAPRDTIKKYIGSSAILSAAGPTRGDRKDDPLEESEETGEFEGRFIFSFDERGRIHSHTIEHAEDDPHVDTLNNPSLRQITLVDWLLGKLGGGHLGGLQGAAACTTAADLASSTRVASAASSAASSAPATAAAPPSNGLWRPSTAGASCKTTIPFGKHMGSFGFTIGNIVIVPGPRSPSSYARASPIGIVSYPRNPRGDFFPPLERDSRGE